MSFFQPRRRVYLIGHPAGIDFAQRAQQHRFRIGRAEPDCVDVLRASLMSVVVDPVAPMITNGTLCRASVSISLRCSSGVTRHRALLEVPTPKPGHRLGVLGKHLRAFREQSVELLDALFRRQPRGPPPPEPVANFELSRVDVHRCSPL